MTASHQAWPTRSGDDHLAFHDSSFADVNFGVKNLVARPQEKYAAADKLTERNYKARIKIYTLKYLHAEYADATVRGRQPRTHQQRICG
ncbi:MAG TPA: hypothetical protein VL976_05725 [Xanthobacteraceae bacterium]|nr:hypothetical protein [Xanthobacteraceae bacterium]